MNLFKHTPCIKCKTTIPKNFTRKEKHFCNSCKRHMKFSPQNQDYYIGLVNQKLLSLYWKTTNNNGINYGQPYSQIHLQQTR